ncbi:hypothetical protein KJ865_13700, partial [Myxococcota bacterium]|nr:hypothetical protein [Myxococcota bacterium]
LQKYHMTTRTIWDKEVKEYSSMAKKIPLYDPAKSALFLRELNAWIGIYGNLIALLKKVPAGNAELESVKVVDVKSLEVRLSIKSFGTPPLPGGRNLPWIRSIRSSPRGTAS